MSNPKSVSKNNTSETEEQKSHSKGKTPREIMNKHIQDKDDIISEEDFRNLDLDLTEETEQNPLGITDDAERPKDEDKDPDDLTPWDVLK